MKRYVHALSRPGIAGLLTALALTLVLYHDALTLPLFSDDLLQIPWLQSITWAEIWTAASPYGYYRPLWYSLWRIWGIVVGGLHPAGLHLLNVIAHVLASWLAGLLTSTWIKPRQGVRAAEPNATAAALAAAIFTVFPFSRQAVAWPGAIYNPLVSAMAAGAILAYDRARSRSNSGDLLLALLLMTLAPLTYEAGLMVAPTIVVLEIIGWWRQRWSTRASWWGLLPIISFTGTVLFWKLMRGSGITGFGLTPDDLLHNLGYILQGLIYPAAPLAQVLSSATSLSSVASLLLIAIPMAGFLIWRGLCRQPDACLLSLGWIFLFALPPTVSMTADWFTLAPRFLYMIACGTAMLWTITVLTVLEDIAAIVRQSCARIVRFAALLAVATALIPAILFVRRGMNLYSIAGEPIWAAAEAAACIGQNSARGSERVPLLFVNMPMRLTPHTRIYPLGFEGVTPLPQRVTAEGLVSVHTELDLPARAAASGLLTKDKPDSYDVLLWGPELGWQELAEATRAAGTVFVARYGPHSISLEEAGGALLADSSSLSSAFTNPQANEKIYLLNLNTGCDRDGRVSITANWKVETPPRNDVTVFAHLLADAAAAPVSQADGYPLLGMRPFWLWQPSEQLRDARYFTPVPPGEYVVHLGLWELASGAQWENSATDTSFVSVPVTCP